MVLYHASNSVSRLLGCAPGATYGLTPLQGGAPDLTPGLLAWLIHMFCNGWHMSLLFAISGHLHCRSCYTQQGSPRRRKIARHVASIAAVYVLWSLLLALFQNLGGGATYHAPSWRDALMIGLRPIGEMWYLHSLIALYLLCAIVLRLCRGRRWALWGATLLLLAIAANGCLSGTAAWSMAHYAPWFMLGALSSGHVGRPPFRRLQVGHNPWGGAAAGLALTMAGYLCHLFTNAANGLAHEALMVAGVTQLCLALGRNNALERLGQLSLQIYLMHIYPIVAARIAIGHAIAHIDGLPLTAALIAALTLAGLLGSLAMWRLIERLRLAPALFFPERLLAQRANQRQQPDRPD